jgi:hypothetical protein
MRGEVAREPARSEKIGEDLAVVVTVVQEPAGRTVVETMKPVSTPVGWVSAWPPRRSSASNSVT